MEIRWKIHALMFTNVYSFDRLLLKIELQKNKMNKSSNLHTNINTSSSFRKHACKCINFVTQSAMSKMPFQIQSSRYHILSAITLVTWCGVSLGGRKHFRMFVKIPTLKSGKFEFRLNDSMTDDICESLTYKRSIFYFAKDAVCQRSRFSGRPLRVGIGFNCSSKQNEWKICVYKNLKC